MFRNRNTAGPATINDHTLEQVVLRYLIELDNPVPDVALRETYRKWMGEFVEYEYGRH